jgi:TolB-like protein/Tfp pilus assembly protein PilF
VNLRNFFAELKRRNVYKVAVAYAVVGWLVMQVCSTVVPALHLPDSVTTAVVVLTLLGFPIALVIAWAFEMTPEGMKRTEDVSPDAPIPQWSRRKFAALIAVIALLAAGLFVYQLVGTARWAVPSDRDDGRRSAASLPIPEKSIAVLPFDNLSDDKSNSYFAEGVQDEILTRLAKVADLKVISRTSTQHFKSAPENLPEIARQLGVANILEGSVQRSGDQVRVNVQLIKARTDAHLWADIFDRKLTDIFAVESDIAKTIADTLQAKLTGSEQTAISKTPTANQQAYELYLKGRFFWNKRTGPDLKKAAEFFQQAITADPNYAGAYAGLAQTQLLIPVFGIGKPPDFFPPATSAARRAIALDETSAEGHSALAMLLLFDFKFAESEKEFHRAIEANPNYATAHHWFGNTLLVTLGRFDEGVKEGKRAVELDPLSLIINADLGSTLMIGRRYEDAIGQFKRTLALDDKFAYAHWNLGEALYLKGDVNAAITEYEKARSLDDDPEILALLGRAYAETGRRGEALELLARLQEKGKTEYVRNYLYTILYIGLGDRSTAIDYLEKAREGAETPDTVWIRVDPLFDPLRGEPRFQELVARLFPHNP